ncbi:sodium-dependent lysophosphatidylcholine symporter 1-like isoform X4 [Struthio camelus]|uniref:sodium-dependent lysophosphatidylcholine symporter 1-like isoform X4 n=1 Tax=Struthio camelus TaxID=8801 RepID=UPI003603EA5D
MMLPAGREDAELPRLTQEEALPQRRVVHSKEEPGLPLCRKVCYAIGGIPYQMTGNALGFFFQIFLLDVVQLEPFHASLILFLGRAWDAVTDPAIGFLVSKSPRRKCGKMIPWIACSMPFGVLFYCMMWSIVPDATPVSLKFLWYLFMYSFFQTCMTCYHVPYSSLTMFLGGTQRDRDLATAYRPLSPLGKVGLPFSSCLRTILEHKPYTQLLCGFLFASLAFQVRDLSQQEESLGDEMLQAGSPVTDSELRTPAMNVSVSPSQVAQGIFAVFCTHAAGLAGKFQHLVLVMLVTASLSIPFWQWFLGRFGKKTAVSSGLVLIIPALVAITQVMHNFLAFIFLMIVAGCSMAVLYLLPWSMLPDVVDDFRLRNPSCLNLEALFYSLYVFFNKFAGGLAVGISTLSLHFAGYQAGDCMHNPSVILALQLLIAPVPISLLLVAIIIFSIHPINKERRKQMRMEMEAIGHHVQHGNT